MFKKLGLVVSVCALVFGFGAWHVFAESATDRGLGMFQAEAEDEEGEVFAGCTTDQGLGMFQGEAEDEEGEDIWVAGYCDGRINAFDIAQPVAIYYTYETAQLTDDNGNAYLSEVVSGIELWAIDEQGDGHLVLWVPVADIEEAFEETDDVEIASVDGITLSYSPSAEEFTVTAPGYAFSWEPWDA